MQLKLYQPYEIELNYFALYIYIWHFCACKSYKAACSWKWSALFQYQ